MSLRVALRPSIYRTGAQLYLMRYEGDRLYFAKPLAIEWEDAGPADGVCQLPAPTLMLSRSDVETLKASIKEEGQRAGLIGDDHGAAEQMKTMKEHLEDMRVMSKSQMATIAEALLRKEKNEPT